MRLELRGYDVSYELLLYQGSLVPSSVKEGKQSTFAYDAEDAIVQVRSLVIGDPSLAYRPEFRLRAVVPNPDFRG